VFKSNIGPNGEKPGYRVQITEVDDPYTDLKPGQKGTVSFIDDFGTVHVKWDDGTTLGLLSECDKWIVISK
jgi:hypothetical protein